MKKLIVIAILLSGCGGSESSNCSKSPLLGMTITTELGTIVFNENCTYVAHECLETGSFDDAGNNVVSLFPERTICDTPYGKTCTYAISGETISYVCTN